MMRFYSLPTTKMEIIKNVELNFLGKKKKLKLIKAQYTNNNRDYYGLLDKDGELFADITVNIPELNCYRCEHIIDRDFINCCFNGNMEKCLQWLKTAFDGTYLENRGQYYSFIY